MNLGFKSNNRVAFSLIEMSAVLIIISLIITATLKTKSILDNSRLDSIIADIKNYSQKAEEFETIYGGIPGDFANVAVLPSSSPAAVAGNGNGIIDTSVEAMNFWRHMQIAGLITGNFDGLSSLVAFDPEQPNIPGGYPLSRFPNAAITVANNATLGLQYSISFYPAADYKSPVFTPVYAYDFDKKYDDGNPDTGMIQASDGTGVPAGNCRTTGAYTISNSSVSCYINIFTNSKAYVNLIGSSTTCNGTALGASRISSTTVCPEGYKGAIINNCTTSGWQNSRSFCEPVTCGSGINAGDTVSMSCAPGYTGVGSVTMTCSNDGVMYPSSNNCASFTDVCSASSVTRNLPCPIGFNGTWTQVCSGSPGVWSNNFAGCTPITCSGGVALGSKSPSAGFTPCNNGYNQIGISGAIQVCSLPLTSSSTGTLRMTEALPSRSR
jgi:hypothetical protein